MTDVARPENAAVDAFGKASRIFSQVAIGAIAAGIVAAAAIAGAGRADEDRADPDGARDRHAPSETAGDLQSARGSDGGGSSAQGDRGALPSFPVGPLEATGPAAPVSPAPSDASRDASESPATNAAAPPGSSAATAAPAVATGGTQNFPAAGTPSVGTSAAGAPAVTSAPAGPVPVVADDNAGTPGLKPAKVLFGGVKTSAPLAPRAIGSYAKGCLAGAKALPVDGDQWQAMRLSRNRNWGHPKLIALVQKLAKDGREKDGWPGLLVGDLSQPRGGPMLTGHASHQIGLDADIWLTPMPDRRLSNEERETMSATSMLADDAVSVAREKWTPGHLNILKRAASYSEVERVLVHPAIKQVLCFAAQGDRGWLHKVRPYWGHHYHFHIRIGCPPGSEGCQSQAPPPGDDGCGKELDDWLKRVGNAAAEPTQPIPVPPAKPVKEPPPITLDKLPEACRVVLATGNPDAKADVAAASSAAAERAKQAREKLAKGGKPVQAGGETAVTVGTAAATASGGQKLPLPSSAGSSVPTAGSAQKAPASASAPATAATGPAATQQ